MPSEERSCENCANYWLATGYDEYGDPDGDDPTCDASEGTQDLVGRVGHENGIECKWFEPREM